MKSGLFVSLFAALALMIAVPTSADAVGLGKQCGGFPGIQCDAGLFCQKKPGQMVDYRHIRYLRQGPEILHADLPPGLRLRSQDLQQ
jgi:hypothetical protein